jgi:glycosyltransferase involved in cell wall biosynthesis
VRRVVHYAAAAIHGGLLRHVALLAPLTAAHGWQSEVFIRPEPALDAIASELHDAGVLVRRLTVTGRGDLRGLLALRRALREIAPSILHVHLASPVESLPVIVATPRLSTARIVTTEHAPTHHPSEWPWSRAVKRIAQRHVARVIALSDADARYLRESFGVPGPKIRRLASGVPLPPSPPSRREARGRLGLREGDLVLGYAGEIAEKKGVGDLLGAMAAIEGAPIALLAGEGPLTAALREEAARAGLGDRFRLLGSLRPPDDLYAACDLFVLPSHGEAMPLALLEAMAAGRPVVATAVGGIPEAIQEGVEGLLVAPRDRGALASAIARLLGDAPARERMGRAARARVERSFGVERMAAAVCALYDEVDGPGRGGSMGGRA